MDGATPSSGPPPRRRILIIDNQPLMRRGLIALIEHEPNLMVCAAAATPRAGLEALESCQPDLIITGLPLVDDGGLAMVKDVHARHAGAPVLVFAMHASSAQAQKALQAGARGYVAKREQSETLLVAIRRVLDGKSYVSTPGTLRPRRTSPSNRP